MILGIVFQVHHRPTLLSPSAHGRGYCSWWVSHQIMCTWANENEEVNCWLRNRTVFLCFSKASFMWNVCVCRSVSAGYSPVTCGRAIDAASFRRVGSGGRTSAGAFTSLGNPGHTFRFLDPQKRGHHPCRPSSGAGVTATSRLTLITELCNLVTQPKHAGLWQRRGGNETEIGRKHERQLCGKDVAQCQWILTVCQPFSADVCRIWNCILYIPIIKSLNLCVLVSSFSLIKKHPAIMKWANTFTVAVFCLFSMVTCCIYYSM